MKLHVLSDLHLEFADFTPPKTDADIVLLAGDIHVGTKAVAWAQDHFSPTPVVYVLGNHEYYGNATPRLQTKVRNAAADSNVHLLERNELVSKE